jgi:hypothetical protein
MHHIARFFEYLRQRLCPLCGASSATLRICSSPKGTSFSAILMFVFGIWMLLLGSAFVILPLFANKSWFRKIRDIAIRFGFPLEERVASILFGVSIASFSLFYFAAGVFEIQPFYWMSIFGRLGVFGTCAVLAWWHGNKDKAAPHALLLAAVPDLGFAQATAWTLLPNYLARVTFIGGTIYLVVALGFFAFPIWILRYLRVEAKPGSWTVVLGALLTFFGAYAIAAALLDYIPIIWASIVATIAVLGTVTGVLAAQPNETLGASSAIAKWRLVGIVFLMLATVLGVAVGGLRQAQSDTLKSATLSKVSEGVLVAGAN